MKVLLLVMFLISGCSTAQYYKADDVIVELKKNSNQLQIITFNVESDYSDKLAFYENFRQSSKNKDNFIVQDLGWRLNDLKLKRDSILHKSAVVKELNDGLLTQLQTREVINEKDPIFKKIDHFSKTTVKEAGHLFNEYASYKNASTEFARFALFTGNLFKKSTSVER